MVKEDKSVSEKKNTLAVVVPVYRSTKTVYQLVLEIKKAFESICPFHIYLVEDGNKPEVVEYLKEHCLQEHVTLLSLAGNYGQQNAVFCGLERALEYEYIATMDDDLKHPVSVLTLMWKEIQEGYDLIYGVPDLNCERAGKYRYSAGSRMRDVLFSSLLHCPPGIRVSSFRIMRREVEKEVVK